MKKLFLLLIILLGAFAADAEQWQAIGTGFYEDPVWSWVRDNGNVIVSGNVNVEESLNNPGRYRFRSLISNDNIVVDCRNTNAVYVEDYSASDTSGNKCTLSQRCAENGWNVNNYGALIDGKVTIPSEYFSLKEQGEDWKKLSSGRQFVFQLPKPGSSDMAPGIYFGIVAFNYLPNFYNIRLIDSSNKENYCSFVDSQELDDYTYLYYSVDRAIEALAGRGYPKDLSNVTLITFTDGNDDGSLEMAPNTSWTDIDYQNYIREKIQNTYVQGKKLDAFSIGLKGIDIGDYNYDMFKSNLRAMASDEEKASEVSDMAEVEKTLNQIIDQLQTSWLTKKVQIKINMRGTGDRLRFTLDKTRAELNDNPENSELWIEGVFNRESLSLNDIEYHGLTSSTGNVNVAETVSVNGKSKYQFTFENLRDLEGNLLETGEINYWHKGSNSDAWTPHTESQSEGDVNTETEYSSAAIMLVMDCSSSLGKSDFEKLKDVVKSMIERLADKTHSDEPGGDEPGGDEPGGDEPGKDGIANVTIEDDAPVEFFNLQGVSVENPSHGFYIMRQGNKATRIYIK